MSPGRRDSDRGGGRAPRRGDSNSRGHSRGGRGGGGGRRGLGGREASEGPGLEAELETGQVWTYATRPGEEDSRVTIGKLERLKDGTGVVHVRIDGLELKNSMAPGGVTQEIVHAPVHEVPFRESIREREGHAKRLPNFQEGLLDWKRAFGTGEADVFNVSLAEIVDWLEESFRRSS